MKNAYVPPAHYRRRAITGTGKTSDTKLSRNIVCISRCTGAHSAEKRTHSSATTATACTGSRVQKGGSQKSVKRHKNLRQLVTHSFYCAGDWAATFQEAKDFWVDTSQYWVSQLQKMEGTH